MGPASGFAYETAIAGCSAFAMAHGARLHRAHRSGGTERQRAVGVVDSIMLDVSHKQLADESAVKPAVSA
jgi:hypothetical protein